jgi:hypothetical protein
MKTYVLTYALLVLVGVPLAAQTVSAPGGSIPTVDTLPATCSPSGVPNVVFKRTAAVGIYACTGTDIWTPTGTSGTGDFAGPGSSTNGDLVSFSGTTGKTGADSGIAGSNVALKSLTLAQFAATTSAQLAGVISDETGSGLLVFSTSPTLVTPVLGVATATTINKVTITAPATGSTITIADGKILTISNTLTFTGTDSSSVAFSAGGTVAYVANNLSVFAATTSAQLAGIISDETGSGALVFAASPTLTGTLTASAITATGAVDFSGASAFKIRIAAGLTTAANGDFGLDTTANFPHIYLGASDRILVHRSTTTPTSGNCAQWGASGILGEASAACGSGGGGYATVQDEGSALTQRATLNFLGAGVTCVDNAGATKTDCTIPGGTSGSLSGLTAATASNSINNGDNAQVWNTALTTASKIFFKIGESAASTGSGAQLMRITTAASSTADPAQWDANGIGYKVDLNGQMVAVGQPYSGATVWSGLTSGASGWGVADVAGTSILYLMPTTNGTTGQYLKETGSATCPTLPTGAPTTCHSSAWDTLTLASADFANQGTATTVLHGNASGNPSFGAVSLTADITGTLALGNGGLGITSGTSGGVPYFSASSTVASSGALTANLPVIGGGAGAAPTVGTRSGNTTAFVTTTGSQTSGDCVKIDANGNHVANGSACGTGGGGSAGGSYFTAVSAAGAGPDNSATETSILPTTTTGSKTIPASTWADGTPLDLEITGFFSTPASPNTLTITTYCGSTVLGTAAVIPVANATNEIFLLKLTIWGAGTNALLINDALFLTGTGGVSQRIFNSSAVAFTYSNTCALEVKATWSAAQSGELIKGTGAKAQIGGAPVSSVFGQTGAVANLSGAVTTSGSSVTTAGKIDVTNANAFCSDAGSTDAYACNLSPAITAYATGTHYRFKANTVNTGAASINFNSIGARTIKKVVGGITTDLADNDIRAGQWVDLVDDGTNMQMQSTLGNAASGSGTVTTTGTMTSTAIVTSAGTTVIQTPSATATMDASGNISTPGSITACAGCTTAGMVSLPQGTANTAAANNILIQAPTSVTAYQRTLPGSAATGFYLGTNSGGTVTDTQVASTGSGSVALATNPTMILSGATVNSMTLTGMGVPLITGNVSNVTGQSTSQSQVTIATSPTAGAYRLVYYANQNALCTTGSNSVAFKFSWTDVSNTRELTTGSLSLGTAQTTAAYISGEPLIYAGGSGNITYTSTVTGTCGSGTSTYDVHVSLERLQ